MIEMTQPQKQIDEKTKEQSKGIFYFSVLGIKAIINVIAGIVTLVITCLKD
ncbi:unnamed protein product [marine sediment metagenome]|uniref:Uncharacterized protein n=1 Tax=marine sediment metagenome TaxID=412755 RepID=X1S6P7_9ZZZZ